MLSHRVLGNNVLNASIHCTPCHPHFATPSNLHRQNLSITRSSSHPSFLGTSRQPHACIVYSCPEQGAQEAFNPPASSPSSVYDDEDPNFGLILPDACHQRELDMDTRKTLQNKANSAAREKTLQYIQVGQKGLTQSFLAATMDLLGKYELVRVRLPDGLDKWKAVRALERLLDSVCVHQIGFTATLYRKKGLPRPSNCPPNAPPSPRALQQQRFSRGMEADGSSRGARADVVRLRQRVGSRGRVGKARQLQKPTGRKRTEQRPDFGLID